MSYDSSHYCSSMGCAFKCCDSSGACPASSSNCRYSYDSYYCRNPCTNAYIYSPTPCSPNGCEAISQLEGSLIGIIVGCAVLCIILSCIICYCCNRHSARVAHQEHQQKNQDQSLTVINGNRQGDTLATMATSYSDEGEAGFGRPIPHWKRIMHPSLN